MKYFESELISSIEQIVEGAEYIDCEFSLIDFENMPLKNTRFIECRFNQVNMSNCNITGASFRDVSFFDSKLMGINWSSVGSLADLSFKDCILNFSVFSDLNIPHTNFTHSQLKEVDFSRSDLNKANFQKTTLSGAIFNRTNLKMADFSEASDYEVSPLENQVKGAIFTLPEALSLLASFDVKIN